ncbi:MAG TPA: hypothetical protein VL101_15795 [Nordella sp.]|nr:hypothetical protein [Nordella sp.]
MTAGEFSRFFAERAETLLPGVKMTVEGELEVRIEMESGGDNLVVKSYLHNAFREYAGDPAEIDAIIKRYVGGAREAFVEAPRPSREQLVLVVRDKFASDLRQWPLAGDLHVIYAFDMPGAVGYPSQEKLDELGLDDVALKALALDNLKRIRMTPRIEVLPTFASVSSGDPYPPSLLLDDDFWSAERFPYRGDIVVIVAARDLVLVTGSHESEGLEAVAKIAHEVADEAPHAISTNPIVRRDGAWQSFVQ